jgi:hypothetical protein
MVEGRVGKAGGCRGGMTGHTPFKKVEHSTTERAD